MKWCCEGFRVHFLGAGEQGFSILVVESDGEKRFLIQHRSVQLGLERKVEVEDGSVALVSQTGLRYCPWCGTSLARRYKRLEVPPEHQELSI